MAFSIKGGPHGKQASRGSGCEANHSISVEAFYWHPPIEDLDDRERVGEPSEDEKRKLAQALETMSRKSSERTYTRRMKKVLQIARSLLPAAGKGGTNTCPLSPCGSSGGCRLANPREVLFYKIRPEGQRLLKMQMKIFQTTDIHLATALKLQGFKLLSIDKNPRTHRGSFVFEDRSGPSATR